MTELVSVLLPTYNDSVESLKTSIDSVLGQTYKNLELLIIDDGSFLPFAGLNKTVQDSRITWLLNACNKGVAFSRNKAAQHAQGDYLAFLDAGDWWEAEKIQKQLKLFKIDSDKLALVFCGARFYPQDSTPYSIFPRLYADWVKALLIGQPIVGSSSAVVLKKDIFCTVGGFYDKEDIPEDRDLWLRIAQIKEIDFVSEPLTNIGIDHETGQSRSSDPQKKSHSYRRFLEIHENEIKHKKVKDKAYASYHASIAQKYFLMNDIKNGMKETFHSIRYYFLMRSIIRCFVALFAFITGIPYRDCVLFFRKKLLHKNT